ncbi:MAG: ATP-binding protein [Sutterellaceae bacterium]|nr:ATP-binding protein [Burkholderiaceae bacterium]MDW8429377.1 ATP-binding protein [Sutterellaceae bacterium]
MTTADVAYELLKPLQSLLARLEPLLPPAEEIDWSAPAYRWRKRRYLGVELGRLEPVHRVARIALEDLHHIEAQKQALLRNTEQFVRGLPANHVLLTGARGTGKSSLIRACLTRFAAEGLRLVEVDKRDLIDLPDIVTLLAGRPERFILFCDDLSFDEGESSYKALKAQLDGSVTAPSDNVLIYATSNRRHLMPEYMRENLQTRYEADGEIHPAESVEEKISLSERFGLWLSFHPFRQDDYLDIVAHWLAYYGADAALIATARTEALQFALQRGSRSGRVALQFARDFAGRHGLRALA